MIEQAAVCEKSIKNSERVPGFTLGRAFDHGFVGRLEFAVAAWAMPAGVDALHGESVAARALDAAQQFGRINGNFFQDVGKGSDVVLEQLFFNFL